MKNSSKFWFVAYTRPNCEKIVGNQLGNKDINYFLPRMLSRVRRNEKLYFVEKPLFRSYIFVQTKKNPEVIRKVYQTYGLINILGYNGQPKPISDDEIESIKILVAKKPHEVRVYHNLVKGQKVIIASGPLKGAVGVLIERRDKKKELVVSIELMKRSVAVTLAEDLVDSLDKY